MSDLEKIHASVARSETAGQGADRGRRRLIRGAVAVAPVILTLRSGALAAASCTGVRVLTVDVQGGVIQPPYQHQEGDYCVIAPETLNCPGEKISGGLDGGTVVPHQSGNGYQCSNITGNQTGVAILSSMSAASLGFGLAETGQVGRGRGFLR